MQDSQQINFWLEILKIAIALFSPIITGLVTGYWLSRKLENYRASNSKELENHKASVKLEHDIAYFKYQTFFKSKFEAAEILQSAVVNAIVSLENLFLKNNSSNEDLTKKYYLDAKAKLEECQQICSRSVGILGITNLSKGLYILEGIQTFLEEYDEGNIYKIVKNSKQEEIYQGEKILISLKNDVEMLNDQINTLLEGVKFYD